MQLNHSLYEQLGRKISDEVQDTLHDKYHETVRECTNDIVSTIRETDGELTPDDMEDIFGGVLCQTGYIVTFTGPFEVLAYSGHSQEVLHEIRGLGESDTLADVIADAAYESMKRDAKQHIVDFLDIDEDRKKRLNEI